MNKIIFKVIALSLIFSMVVTTTPSINTHPENQSVLPSMHDQVPTNVQQEFMNSLDKRFRGADLSQSLYEEPASTAQLPNNVSGPDFFLDNDNSYSVVAEPWRTKAANHVSKVSDDGKFLAIGTGYLADNEVHIYRWDDVAKTYKEVWTVGDQIIKSDIMDIEFADTDNNNFLEIVVASSDGRVYVFEQGHIFDPITSMENKFDLVWTSPRMMRVWSIAVADIDLDGLDDIIAGGWDGKLHVFEYDKRSQYPFSPDHWISYEEIWTSEDLGSQIYGVEAGDFDGDQLPEVAVGTRDGRLIIFENAGVVLPINGEMFPLPRDNTLHQVWESDYFTTQVWKMAAGNLDENNRDDELALVASHSAVFVLDYHDSKYNLHRLTTEPKYWEDDGNYPIDHYITWMINASNVYANGDYTKPEPTVQFSVTSGNAGMSFDNTDFSRFFYRNAWAVVDFGFDQGATGNGNTNPDIEIEFLSSAYLTPYAFNFSLSPDGINWAPLSASNVTVSGNKLLLDIDSVLKERNWDQVEFFNLTVNSNHIYDIRKMETYQIAYNIHTATSISILSFPMKPTLENLATGHSNKILIGTETGTLMAFARSTATEFPYKDKVRYAPVWDSFENDDWSLNTAIWSIEPTVQWNPIMNIYGPITQTTLPSAVTLDVTYTNDAYIGDYMTSPLDVVMVTYNGEPGIYVIADPLINPDPFAPINQQASDQYDTIEAYYRSKNRVILAVDMKQHIWDHPALKNPYGYSVDYPYVLVAHTKVDTWLTSGFTGPLSTDELWKMFDVDLWGYVTRLNGVDINKYIKLLSLSDADSSGKFSGGFYPIESLGTSSLLSMKAIFADMDNDGLEDIIVSTGYLYLFKQIPGTSIPRFTYVEGYFDAINEATSNRGFSHPRTIDYDRDGDLDIMLSFSTKAGFTFFENYGTPSTPEWIEKRSFVQQFWKTNSFSYYDMTNGAFVFTSMTSPVDEFKWYFLARSRTNGNVFWYETGTDDQQAIMISTYPATQQILLNKVNDTAYQPLKNFGFSVLETWSNKYIINDWTQAVAVGVLDGDNNREFVIGDYDNNVYVFEHLTNNTYKRAFRTTDLNRTEATGEEPYYSDVLTGVGSGRNRTIFEHTIYVLADLDLNNNGLKEFLAVTKDKLFLFENTGYNDEYAFIWEYDFTKDTDYMQRQLNGYNTYNITAVTASNDFDGDGYGEIFVALGNMLYVLEYDPGLMGFFNWFHNAYSTQAGQKIIGNPAYSPFTIINRILLADTDKDGNYEAILAGQYTYKYCNDAKAFLVVLEYQYTLFTQVWNAEDHIKPFVENNHFNDLAIDDQDYDNKLEIIVAHEYGVDVLEQTGGIGSNNYVRVESITGTPGYPIESVVATDPPSERQKVSVVINKETKSIRDYYRGHDLASSDIAWVPFLNRFLAVYSLFSYDINTGYAYYLYWELSADETGKVWNNSRQRVSDSTNLMYYGDDEFALNVISHETQPSILIVDSKVYLAWIVSRESYAGLSQQIAVTSGSGGSASDPSGFSWNTGAYLVPYTKFTTVYTSIAARTNVARVTSPTLYRDSLNNNIIRLAWVRLLLPVIFEIKLSDSFGALTAGPISFYILPRNYLLHSIDAIRTNDAYVDWAISMNYVNFTSGAGYSVFDVYYMQSNETDHTWQYMTRVSEARDMKTFPSINVLYNDFKTIMIGYDRLGEGAKQSLSVSYSNNGYDWFGSYDLVEDLTVWQKQLKDLYQINYETCYYYYYDVPSEMDGYVTGITVGRIGIAPTPTGGFAYGFPLFFDLVTAQTVQNLSLATYSLAYFTTNYQLNVGEATRPLTPQIYGATKKLYSVYAVGVNDFGSFAFSNVTKVQTIAVGDTDMDGRREIVAGYGTQFEVIEIQHSFEDEATGKNRMYYQSKYISNSLNATVHDLEVFDVNNNGFEEIVVAAARGNVFVYEVTDTTQPVTNPQIFTTTTSLGSGDPAYNQADLIQTDVKILRNMNTSQEMVAFFGNYKDPITNKYYPSITFLDATTTNINKTIIDTHPNLYPIKSMIVRYTGSNWEDLLILWANETYRMLQLVNPDQSIILLEGTGYQRDGERDWYYDSLRRREMGNLYYEDIDNNDVKDIIYINASSIILFLNHDQTPIMTTVPEYTVNTNAIKFSTIGNFDDDAGKEFAYFMNNTKAVSILDYDANTTAWTTILSEYTFPDVTYDVYAFTSADIDLDGIDDFMIEEQQYNFLYSPGTWFAIPFSTADSSAKTFTSTWNVTTLGVPYDYKVIDMDNDGIVEIMANTLVSIYVLSLKEQKITTIISFPTNLLAWYNFDLVDSDHDGEIDWLLLPGFEMWGRYTVVYQFDLKGAIHRISYLEDNLGISTGLDTARIVTHASVDENNRVFLVGATMGVYVLENSEAPLRKSPPPMNMGAQAKLVFDGNLNNLEMSNKLKILPVDYEEDGIIDAMLYVDPMTGLVSMMNASNGKSLWSFKYNTSNVVLSSNVVIYKPTISQDSMIVMIVNNHDLAFFDVQTGELIKVIPSVLTVGFITDLQVVDQDSNGLKELLIHSVVYMFTGTKNYILTLGFTTYYFDFNFDKFLYFTVSEYGYWNTKIRLEPFYQFKDNYDGTYQTPETYQSLLFVYAGEALNVFTLNNKDPTVIDEHFRIHARDFDLIDIDGNGMYDGVVFHKKYDLYIASGFYMGEVYYNWIDYSMAYDEEYINEKTGDSYTEEVGYYENIQAMSLIKERDPSIPPGFMVSLHHKGYLYYQLDLTSSPGDLNQKLEYGYWQRAYSTFWQGSTEMGTMDSFYDTQFFSFTFKELPAIAAFSGRSLIIFIDGVPYDSFETPVNSNNAKLFVVQQNLETVSFYLLDHENNHLFVLTTNANYGFEVQVLGDPVIIDTIKEATTSLAETNNNMNNEVNGVLAQANKPVSQNPSTFTMTPTIVLTAIIGIIISSMVLKDTKMFRKN